MGGSGGGYFKISDPGELSKKIRDSEEKTKNQKFETDVSSFISDLLVKYNDRDIVSISNHLDTIKKALEKEIDGSLDILFGGSVSKHTYVDGLSDIDALIVLNNSELKGLSPAEVKEYFYARLKERLPNTEIRQGRLAVTVQFNNIEIQLLPAIKGDNGLKIADTSGKQWANIKPEKFTTLLTNVNKEMNSKVVPTIKIAKSIISTLPENRQLSGYHVESLAVEIFKSYDGERNTKTMLKYFFNEAQKLVLSPIRDKTGQSIHVDDYLGQENSLQRKIVSDAVGRIGRKLKNADGAQSLEQWKSILGGL